MHYNVNSLSSVITQMLYFYKSEGGGGKRTEQADICFYTAHTHQRQKIKKKR